MANVRYFIVDNFKSVKKSSKKITEGFEVLDLKSTVEKIVTLGLDRYVRNQKGKMLICAYENSMTVEQFYEKKSNKKTLTAPLPLYEIDPRTGLYAKDKEQYEADETVQKKDLSGKVIADEYETINVTRTRRVDKVIVDTTGKQKKLPVGNVIQLGDDNGKNFLLQYTDNNGRQTSKYASDAGFRMLINTYIHHIYGTDWAYEVFDGVKMYNFPDAGNAFDMSYPISDLSSNKLSFITFEMTPYNILQIFEQTFPNLIDSSREVKSETDVDSPGYFPVVKDFVWNVLQNILEKVGDWDGAKLGGMGVDYVDFIKASDPVNHPHLNSIDYFFNNNAVEKTKFINFVEKNLPNFDPTIKPGSEEIRTIINYLNRADSNWPVLRDLMFNVSKDKTKYNTSKLRMKNITGFIYFGNILVSASLKPFDHGVPKDRLSKSDVTRNFNSNKDIEITDDEYNSINKSNLVNAMNDMADKKKLSLDKRYSVTFTYDNKRAVKNNKPVIRVSGNDSNINNLAIQRMLRILHNRKNTELISGDSITKDDIGSIIQVSFEKNSGLSENFYIEFVDVLKNVITKY